MYVTVWTRKNVRDYIHTRVGTHTAKHCMHLLKVKGERDRDRQR